MCCCCDVGDGGDDDDDGDLRIHLFGVLVFWDPFHVERLKFHEIFQNCHLLLKISNLTTLLDYVIMYFLPSLFIAESKHFLSRQARHWFRWVLSIGQRPLKSP